MHKLFIFVACILLASCAPREGLDKTVAGTVLGAGWGAGAGAVVGNQVNNNSGPGAGVGAGFGAVVGAMTGYNFDTLEDNYIQQDRALSALEVQNAANGQHLAQLQSRLDRQAAGGSVGEAYNVFFDPDATDLRSGALTNLERIADSILHNPAATRVRVVGHSDDAGTPEYNDKLAHLRAERVKEYLAARGISLYQITTESFGSRQPIATNSTPAGRQMNRRVDIYVSR
jgi:outer membrane protein OmpA-like peptidoglycan-associated protein